MDNICMWSYWGEHKYTLSYHFNLYTVVSIIVIVYNSYRAIVLSIVPSNIRTLKIGSVGAHSELIYFTSMSQIISYDIIIIHFSISKLSTIYSVLSFLCSGPVFTRTGPVT